MRIKPALAVLPALLLAFAAGSAAGQEKLKALIIDGRNNHNWKATTPVLRKILEDSGRFTVDVVTAGGKDKDLGDFAPKFSNYAVVVSNYNGPDWPAQVRTDFVGYVLGGGGLVVVHAADNSFPGWREYNEFIGLGGWGGRSEKSGPYVRFREGKFVEDTTPGRGGSHGKQHEFAVEIRNPEHPITAGLPTKWMHAKDELYDRLRGPAKNLTVLATAFAAKEQGGSGEHEPMLMVTTFDKGRIFHTTLGHSAEAMACVGFAVTLIRGAEWAATGKVTVTKVPDDFPTAEKVSVRKY